MEELKAALDALIDARLIEVGLMEDPNAKGKGGKGGKGGKAAAAADDEVTLDTLKEKITTLVNKKGKDAAKALLKKAKVEKLNELPEKHFAKFNELLDAEIGGEEDDLFGE